MTEPDEPIQFYHRYQQSVLTEVVYGEGFLRWTYGRRLGRIALHAMVKRAWFSRWYGWRMNRPASRSKIAPFIQDYKLDTSEFENNPGSFRHFNEFFYRRLKKEARPINRDNLSVVFPADGRHMGFQDISRMEDFFVKGQRLSLSKLLQDDKLADQFRKGTLVFSRLCPVDYHRFHFPVSGIPSSPQLLNGPLFSVNPLALRRRISILTENKRYLTAIQGAQVGACLILEIGATCVGNVVHTNTPNTPVRKGDEKGYFQFGGSSIMVLFEPGRVLLDSDLLDHTRNGMECYARMGDRMGQVLV